MKKNIVVICLVLISLLYTPDLATASEIPEDHIPVPCVGCHGETLNAGVGSQQSECNGCHKYKLDVPKLEEEHNPKICKACHMGNTLINASEKQIFHNGHNAINCTTCHTQDNFTVVKIEGIEKQGFQCVLCHSNKVHTIHIKNISKNCPICHGSWAKGKVYMTNSPISSNDPEKNRNLEKFTIFAFLKQIFDTLFGVI
ncbi:MAG: hypothetical protein OIN87_07210 [Candidatus Methanoperedens sp.]|nr:hypothetical protein [Candidatus Methanoperedens sp.]